MNSNAHRKQPATSNNIMAAAPGWDAIPDFSFALLHYRSLSPSEEAEILQQQRHELAGQRWQDGTWYAKEHSYCEVFISNRSGAVVDEEHLTFRWKKTLLSWSTREIEMIETHNGKQSPRGLFDPDNLSNILSDSHGQVVQLACSQFGIH